jgi:hypothetical protein
MTVEEQLLNKKLRIRDTRAINSMEQSRMLLEKLMTAQVVTEFSVLQFIIVFVRAYRWAISPAS